ncbi:MAG TPA: efflux RND transporter periplasmic adaptor subunit [Acetobacteraceae bacterium]|jgi:membrane fusion protein, multidrug efflux system|nr:efflux RND transporter periplasmic adaptor subunit [Acetobacteraceae bacterium]
MQMQQLLRPLVFLLELHSLAGRISRTGQATDAEAVSHDRCGQRMRHLIMAAALLCPLTLIPGVRAQQPAAVSVGTVTAELKPITRSVDFVGRVEAVQRVDIHARVTGFLQKVLFKEGDLVKEGEALYQIEPDTFQAAKTQAQGALYQAQAKYQNAVAQRARIEELVKTRAATPAQLDQQVAAEKSSQGDIVVATANLQTATVNLGYTDITSPITGEIGRTNVTVGNVVGPNSGTLTTIVSQDPMYVTFPVSQRDLLSFQRQKEKQNAADLAVKIRFADGSMYPETGRINFIDIKVDRATDTVTVRATFPNPHNTLIDGQLVRVSVSTGKPEEKVLIPQAALIVDQQGPYVFLAADGKAVVQRVRLGGESGPDVIVEDGLKGGEQVVVQGMDTLRPGAAVIANPVAAITRQG